MSLHTEINFENEICEHLCAHGWLYEAGSASLYDRARAVFSPDLIGWIAATQPTSWEALTQTHGAFPSLETGGVSVCVTRGAFGGDIQHARLATVSEPHAEARQIAEVACGRRTRGLDPRRERRSINEHFRVGDALLETEKGIAEKPDEVYLLSTGVSVWFGVPLRVDGTTFYDLPLEQPYWETGPAVLDNVTGS